MDDSFDPLKPRALDRPTACRSRWTPIWWSWTGPRIFSVRSSNNAPRNTYRTGTGEPDSPNGGSVAGETSESGAVLTADGRFVDEAVLRQARRTLALAAD